MCVYMCRVKWSLEGTPAQHRYRMPAEREPHSHCCMGWPVSRPLVFAAFFHASFGSSDVVLFLNELYMRLARWVLGFIRLPSVPNCAYLIVNCEFAPKVQSSVVFVC